MFELFKSKPTNVYAPVYGRQFPLAEVNDPVFASGMMGEGIAFNIKDNTLYAPIGGTIAVLAETKHAFGITADNGLKVLVHIGLNTVNLKGKGFKALHKQNDRVNCGEPIIEISDAVLNNPNIDLTVILIVLNNDRKIEIIKNDWVKAKVTAVLKTSSC